MIDIAADLREQAARYTAEADAALASAPAPLPDLETARAQILQQLADVDRRIAARQTAERRHAHLMDISQRLAALAAQHGAEVTAPAPPAEALTAALDGTAGTGAPACRCAGPGRTEDEMYACEADDCAAHDYLATGGALSLADQPEHPTRYPAGGRSALDGTAGGGRG